MAALTPDERDLIIATYHECENVRETARRTGRGRTTVSRILADAGIDAAGRPQTKRACEAKRIDNAARRAQLVSDLLDDADRLRRQLFAPCKVFNFGGRDNTYNEVQLDEPTFADKRHIAGAVRMLAMTAADLERVDQRDDDHSEVRLWLNAMIGGGDAA